MISSNWAILGVVIYISVFTAIVFGIGIWNWRKKKVRPPVNFKLLRGPGETIRRRLARFEENMPFYMASAALAPLLLDGAILLIGARLLPPKYHLYLLIFVILFFILCAVLCGRWLWRKFRENRNYNLGYLGERHAAEELEPLTKHGFEIFHDVPAENNGAKFNIDHVAVGPTGVFAIETKTRRKGRARPGYKDHEVSYDGKILIWPWGEDRNGLDQAERNARWISEWLNKLTGLGITAKPVLALPGWFVKATAVGIVNVVSAKSLPSAVKGRGQRILSDEQIDLISRQLDQKCRDVEE